MQLDLFLPAPIPPTFSRRPVWYDADRCIFRTDPPPWVDYPREAPTPPVQAVMEANP